MDGGAGLPELARAATALTRLTSLTVDVYASRPPTFPAGDLAFIGAALTRLRSLTVPLTASLEWLPPLQALTFLRFGGFSTLSPERLASLEALPKLCTLRFWSWSDGGGDAAQPAAVCTAVTRLVCRAIHPQALPSLQRAFPAVLDADLLGIGIMRDDDDFLSQFEFLEDGRRIHAAAASAGASDDGQELQDERLGECDLELAASGGGGASAPAAVALGPAALAAVALDPGPRWRGLLRLSLGGIPIDADLQPLRRLGALDGLLALKLDAALSGAQLAALLDAAPRLQAFFVAELALGINWRRLRHRRLAVLGVGRLTESGGPDGQPPSLPERQSLLGLGRALPGLQMIILSYEVEAHWLGALGVDVPPGADERPPAAARALSSGLWELPAAHAAHASSLVRALRDAIEFEPQREAAIAVEAAAAAAAIAAEAAAAAAATAAAYDAAAAEMRIEEVARLHRMAEEGNISWREAEARVEELLLAPP
jgi:hypothetical protein